MAEPTVRIRENGPLLLKGPIQLTDHDGRLITAEGDNVALCRCGQSAKKPFCDGAHRGEFQGACNPEVFS